MSRGKNPTPILKITHENEVAKNIYLIFIELDKPSKHPKIVSVSEPEIGSKESDPKLEKTHMKRI